MVLAHRAFNTRVALLAGLLFATNPTAVEYSRRIWQPGPLLFFGTLLLFAPPVVALGMVAPFAIRLALDDVSSAGAVAGRLYALSTAGSLLGTFLPALVTIPAVGTQRTLVGASVLLAANLTANLIIGLEFLTVFNALGGAALFAIFGALSLAAIAFVGRLAPETKGRELEEIRGYWENDASWPEPAAATGRFARTGERVPTESR
jgi:hypothetical protein